MNFKKITLILFSIIILVTGCRKTDYLDNNDNITIHGTNSAMTVTLEEAIRYLQCYPEILPGMVRSDLNGIVSAEAITASSLTPDTRSGLPDIDTLLWSVHFRQGTWALLAGTRYLNAPVLCIADSGEFEKSVMSSLMPDDDTDDDLSEEELDDMIITDADDPNSFISSLLLEQALNTAMDGQAYDWDDSISTRALAPTVIYGPYIQTRWGQARDYSQKMIWNRYTPHHSYLGCEATALSQVIAYNRYPEDMTIDGKPVNWDGITNNHSWKDKWIRPRDTTYDDDVARFAYEIAKIANTHFGNSENDDSYNKNKAATRTLKKLGYPDADYHIGIGRKNQAIVNRNIRAGRPVICKGLKKGSFVGHTWIIDGECGEFYHINWGWKGISDGWYQKGVFENEKRLFTTSQDTYYKKKNIHHRRYTWHFRLATYGNPHKRD